VQNVLNQLLFVMTKRGRKRKDQIYFWKLYWICFYEVV